MGMVAEEKYLVSMVLCVYALGLKGTQMNWYNLFS